LRSGGARGFSALGRRAPGLLSLEGGGWNATDLARQRPRRAARRQASQVDGVPGGV